MIHPTALIHPDARLDPGVEVGPYVIIDGPAEIAAGCRIEAHGQLVGHVVLGAGTVVGRGAVIGGEPQDLSFKADTQSSVILGPNNVIREHVTIHRGSKPGGATRVGAGNFLMAGAHLAHDVELGDGNILANACLLAGHVKVGNHTFIGGGAVFHQFIRVGDYCVIQGNGGVGMDLPHFCAAHKVNRLSGLNIVGLRRHGFTGEQRRQIKELFHLLFCSGLNRTQALEAAREKEWPDPAGRLLEFVAAPSKRGICPWRGGAEVD